MFTPCPKTRSDPDFPVASVDGRAPIDHEVGAGDEGGLVRGEEQDPVRDLDRLSHALHEGVLPEEPASLLPVDPDEVHVPLARLGVDRAGADPVHPDAVLREVQGEAAGELHDAAFRRVVGDESRLGDEAAHGGDVDDRPAPRRPQVGQHRPHRVGVAKDVHPQQTTAEVVAEAHEYFRK